MREFLDTISVIGGVARIVVQMDTGPSVYVSITEPGYPENDGFMNLTLDVAAELGRYLIQLAEGGQ